MTRFAEEDPQGEKARAAPPVCAAGVPPGPAPIAAGTDDLSISKTVTFSNAPASDVATPAARLCDRYRIESALGAGGYGSVFRAWDELLHRTVAIPVIDGSDYLPLCVALLRLQTEPVFITIIDTGSSPGQFAQIAALRAPDLEVHSLQLHGVRHPSDFPAMAMDLAFTLCRSEWLFATHQDVFLRRRDFVADLVEQSRREDIPVIGYEITPRLHDDWKGMISHTATLYHMPAMDRAGVAWSLRKLANLCGLADYAPDPSRPSWPDTEVLSNYFFRHHQLKTAIVGTEQNYQRTRDANIDHPRSIPSAGLYSAQYLAGARPALDAALQEARERITQWRNESSPAEMK